MTRAITLFFLSVPFSLAAQQVDFSIQTVFHLARPAKNIYALQTTERKIDTLAYPFNDTLVYRGTLSKPGTVQFLLDSSATFQLWVDNIPVFFDLNEETTGSKYRRLNITNLTGSDDTRLLHQMTIPISDTYHYPLNFSKSYKDSIAKIFHDKPYKLIDSLFRVHYHSPILPFYINYYRTVLSIDTIKAFYDRLPEDSRDSDAGEDIRKLWQRTALLKKGSTFIDFTIKSSTGKNLSLHSVSAKYILLDFWASWCGPCRGDNPQLVKLYTKYKEKGFEIIGISFDESKTKWLEAIQKDKLSWYHVSALKKWDNELARKYYISGIPFLVLLDSNYKVVALPHFARDLDGILSPLLN